MKRMIWAAFLVAAMVPVGAAAQGSDTEDAEDASIVIEAKTFMAGYAGDLIGGDRNAITNRYDRRGAWRVGEGEKVFESWEAIRRIYAEKWQKPARFGWRDLSYEPIGPDAIVIIGLFDWGLDDGGPPITLSYTALLTRQEGELRIRVEDESAAPSKP